jgi:hypothetical protein
MRLTTTDQCGTTSANGTPRRRAGSAVTTTTRLIALFRTTACRATKPKRPISNGSRNSAPPRPIIPPSTPIAPPPRKAADSDREGTAVAVPDRSELTGSAVTGTP